MKTKNILIVNDDSWNSLGIKALVEALQGIGKLFLVAPSQERSAVGHSATFNLPLRCYHISYPGVEKAYTCDGYPVDCTKLGLLHLLKDISIDLVVSGINHGSNLGTTAFCSGTVAAAREALRHRIPAIAYSLCSMPTTYHHFAHTLPYVHAITQQVLEKGLPPYTGLNVNFPSPDKAPIHGVKLCSQTYQEPSDTIHHYQDPKGEDCYWIKGYYASHHQEGQDTNAIQASYASIVPFSIDTTYYLALEQLKKDLKIFISS